MENYPSYSYPDSGDSSPRSREIDFENPPPSWEDPHQPQQLTKVKLMVSYGGKIQPRTHDNILSYVGGETKILSVDRSLKFSSLFSKLSTILSSDSGSGEPLSGFTFKYQLPGEDLDALISVTNDDDLENMMHEYDRLCRGSIKPARLRVFLFPVLKPSSFGSTSSDKIDRESDRFVEALNSGPVPAQSQVNNSTGSNNNVDFLFGLEKSNVPVQVQVPVPIPVQGHVPVQRHEPDHQIDARIQELNRMQISVQEMNRPKSDEIFTGGNIPVGYWQQQPPPPQQQQQQQQPPVSIEQPPQQPPPQQQQQIPQFHHFQQPPQQISQPPPQQQVYMLHHAPPQYHAPMMRPVTNQQPPPQQGYYRVGSEQVYREQPVYSVGPPPPQQQPGKYTEGMGGVPVRPVESNSVGYHQQVAYDSGSGRQVYYAAPPGSGGLVTAPFQGVSGEMRTVAPPDLNAKVHPK